MAVFERPSAMSVSTSVSRGVSRPSGLVLRLRARSWRTTCGSGAVPPPATRWSASIGLLGALVGTAVAYLAALAYFRCQLSERLSHVPALDLILILTGLSAIAAAGGWLSAGREPSGISRQPLE